MNRVFQCLKSVLLPIFGLFLLLTATLAPTPVFAEPNANTNNTSETTDTTETDPSSTNNSTSNTNANTNTAATTTNATDTCYDNFMSLGWIVCGITNTVGNGVDLIYGLISDLLVIKPISSNTDSPIYIVWEYARNITNIIFIILILIMVYSQVTGFGISNYGIKKVLPRVIITAILVNLSFIICALAIDTSNILGASLNGFFKSVENSVAIQGVNVNWGEVVGAIVGGTTIAGVGVVAAGGFGALIWMLFPVLIAAILAVIVGLITICFRQGIVALLVMISPLAFVAYLLPNTERFFKLWSNILISMLIFYPMFSVLFGASGLAGRVLVASADNLFWVIIGLAVEVLPLFLAVKLMKMSGTVLGTISSKLDNLSAKLNAPAKSFGDEKAALRRARLAAAPRSKNPLAIRNAMQDIEKRKFRRASDLAKFQTAATKRNEAFAEKLTDKNNQLTRRGRRIIEAEDAAATHSALAQRQTQGRIQDRYNRQHAAITAKMNGQITDYYKQNVSYAKAAGFSEDAGISAIIAGAVSDKVAADKAISGDYEDLYNSAVVSSEVKKDMEMAFAGKNALALKAGFDSLAKTADYDKLRALLRDYTPDITSSDPDDIAMQKAIANALRPIADDAPLKGYSKCVDKTRNKADAINTMVEETILRNQRHAAAGEPLEEVPDRMPTFFTYQEYEDDSPAAVRWGVDQSTILQQNDKINVAALQSKAVWDDAKDHNKLPFTVGQRAFAIFNDPGNGEAYEYLIDTHLGKSAKWKDTNTRQQLTFRPTTDANGQPISSTEALSQARQNIHEIIKSANSSQISKFNGTSLEAFATTLSDDYVLGTDGVITYDNTDDTTRFNRLVEGVRAMQANGDFKPNLVSDLHRRAERGQLDDMNPEVRRVLNAVLHFE